MASDPGALIAQLLSSGGVNGFQQGQQQYQDRQLEQAGEQQQLQAGAIQLQAAQQKQQQEQAYQSETQSYLNDPTPAALNRLALKFPDHAEALKQVYSSMDATAKSARLTQFGGLFSAADNNRADLVTKQLTDIKTAEQAQGIDTSDIDDALSGLAQGGDAATQALKTVKGIAQIHIAAADPAKFAQTYSDFGGEDGAPKAVTFGEGGVGHFDGGGKWVVDQAPRSGPTNPKDNYIEVHNADGTTTQKYIGGGGDPASGGGALPATLPEIADRIGTIEGTGNNASSSASGYGQFTNGTWLSTYKAANPNSGMTDTQILAQRANPSVAKTMLANLTARNSQMLQAGGVQPTAPNVYLAHFLGVGDALAVAHADPSTPISQVVSRASVAANPSVLGGKTVGQVQQWATDKMSSGVPGSGASGKDITGDAGSNSIPGDPSKTGEAYLNTLPPGMKNRVAGIMSGNIPYPASNRKDTQPLLNAISQADPTFDATTWKNRNTTATQFGAGGAVGKVLTSGATSVNHLYDLALAAQKLPDHYFGFMNSASNSSAALGSEQGQNLVQFNRSRTLYAPEVSKFLAGSGQAAEGEIKKHYESFDPSLGKTGNLNSLATDVKFITDKFGPMADAYQQTMGKPLVIDGQGKTGGPATAKLAALTYWQDNQSKPLPVVVNSPAQASKLPSGTIFVTLDGQVRTKH